MPNPEIEALTESSSKGQKSAAISACIQREMQAGKSQAEAQGMGIGMVEQKTGGK